MKKMISILFLGIILAGCQNNNYQTKTTSNSMNNITTTPSATPTPTAEKLADNITATIKTSLGEITLELYPKSAPKTVSNFINLAKGTKDWTDPRTNKLETGKSLYQGTIFHRVIPDFMIQGGDPTGTGMGGPGYRFQDEIDPNLKFDKPYILAMANSGPNTNGSQFFITVAPTPWLNGRHTIFGIVTKGQEIVDKISLVKTGTNDKPVTDVSITSVEIVEK